MLCVTKGEDNIEYPFERRWFALFKDVRCVYRIVCKANGVSYVGQTINLCRRLREHEFSLRKEKHRNGSLQYDYNKYGADQFYFIVECVKNDSTESLDDIEREYIEKYRLENKCYNVFSGGLTGYKASDEFRAKISVTHKGRIVSEETRERNRQAAKRQWENEDYRDRMVESAKHQWENEDYRKMMIAMHTGSVDACGHKLSEEDVLTARAEHSSGVSVKELADRYNVACVTMQNAISGRTWKHI